MLTKSCVYTKIDILRKISNTLTYCDAPYFTRELVIYDFIFIFFKFSFVLTITT
jgi:hypothetical protein